MGDAGNAGLEWQTSVWDRMSDVYRREVDSRFAPVVAVALERSGVRPGDVVLDLGTGTGAAALEIARTVQGGHVVAVDISSEMLEIARGRLARAGVSNVTVQEGSAEKIPAADDSFDAIVASLSFMYVIDRHAAAKECARVLKPSGRFVAAVWGGPDDTDIVRFQSTAGRFAPAPPVPGVGPGALADPTSLIAHLREAGIDADVEVETTTFEFPNFDLAWEVLAGVTTANLPVERVAEAKAAVQEIMWQDPARPRTFVNRTQLIVGARR